MAVGAIIAAAGTAISAGVSAANSAGAFSGGSGGASAGDIHLQPYDYLDLPPVTSAFGDFLTQENNIPSLNAFSNEVNQYANTSWQDQVKQLNPEMLNTVATLGQDANSLAQGIIPKDVQAQIQESSAAQAWAGGYGGTQMGSNLTARSLGLTSLNLENEGASLAGTDMSMINALNPSQMNVSDLLFSPQQILQRQDQQAQYNTDLQDQTDFTNAGRQFAAAQTNAIGAQQQSAALGRSITGAGQSLGQAYNSIFGNNSPNGNSPNAPAPPGSTINADGTWTATDPGNTQSADSSLQASLNAAPPINIYGGDNWTDSGS